ncbi:MAG TPA: 2-hydroxyacid dehydrogenase [Bryobacteraceae bacterium]|jgi:D-3-phosphoglycerate dehydrogenase|nr:2-hydroxyacid dehydrogenase [Bryobacteraceae bacterium]
MSKTRIAVIGDHFIPPSLMRANIVAHVGDELEIVESSTPFPLEPFRDIAEVREASGSEEEVIRALHGASLCVAHHAPLTKRVIEACPDLRLFVVCRGGPVNVNIPAARKAGVRICFTPGRNATATAEFAVAMILAALRRVPVTDRGIRNREWPGDYTFETAGFELEGATCGLVGYGAIGSRVARILEGFGASVLAYDPYAKGEAVQLVSLPELLRRSQVVSLHARETPETRGLIGRKEIALMPKGSVLVNCARGALLDYAALEEALRSGHLFAAAVDVFPEEPLPPGSSLRELPNLVMTPHIAGGTRQAAEKAARLAAEEIERYLTGQPLCFCANPE